MEDYTYDLTPGAESILGAHMLEVSPSLSSERASLEIHPLVLPGPNSTTLSTITPMRLVLRLASARAALLGR